jgi:hypothetical protein
VFVFFLSIARDLFKSGLWDLDINKPIVGVNSIKIAKGEI